MLKFGVFEEKSLLPMILALRLRYSRFSQPVARRANAKSRIAVCNVTSYDIMATCSVATILGS